MKDNTTNKYLQTILTMLEEDKHRWDCPDYCGVVVVHPDLVEDTLSLVSVEFSGDVASLRTGGWNTFTLKGGGRLTVTHMESEKGTIRRAEHDHAGMQYTSIMFHMPFAGGYGDLRRVVTGEGISNCFMYMMTRLRSESKYASKFVMM